MRFGKWIYDPETFVLRHSETRYEVDLEQCTTTAETLDMIFQVASKVDPDADGGIWTRDDIADLVLGLDRLLQPQANLCSGGSDIGPIKNIKSLIRLNAGGGAS